MAAAAGSKFSPFSPSSETRRVLEKAGERLLISAARRDGSKQMESPSPNKRKPNESCCPGPVLVQATAPCWRDESGSRSRRRPPALVSMRDICVHTLRRRVSDACRCYISVSVCKLGECLIFLGFGGRTPRNVTESAELETKLPAGEFRRRVLTPSAWQQPRTY